MVFWRVNLAPFSQKRSFFSAKLFMPKHKPIASDICSNEFVQAHLPLGAFYLRNHNIIYY